MIALSCAGIIPAAFNSKSEWQALHLWPGSASPINSGYHPALAPATALRKTARHRIGDGPLR